MCEIEYNDLIFEISEKLDESLLRRMINMCKMWIPEGEAVGIQDMLTFFKVLEDKKRLGIDNLEKLKEILTQLKKRPLLKRVEKFEIKRKGIVVTMFEVGTRLSLNSGSTVLTCTIIASLSRENNYSSDCLSEAPHVFTAVRMVCNFRTLAGSIVLVGSGLALRSCSSFEEYSDAFNKVVLPAFTKLVELSESSLCFTVLAETPSALKELWNIYNNETLKNRLQSFLVTEEIKQLVKGEEMEVTVYIDEKEYRAAYLDLMFQQNHGYSFLSFSTGADNVSQEGSRHRRNSDSFLSLSPKENEVTLMLLNQAENKWNFKMQILEVEIDKLK
ncbi:unnamed protein product, partial [Porites evermanni]